MPIQPIGTEMPESPMSQDQDALLAATIADQLGEMKTEPRTLIRRLTRRLGPIAMTALLEAVWTIEREGGILLPDGRRRTPGGVLFYLTKVGATLKPPRWWFPPSKEVGHEQ